MPECIVSVWRVSTLFLSVILTTGWMLKHRDYVSRSLTNARDVHILLDCLLGPYFLGFVAFSPTSVVDATELWMLLNY